mgnify:FL=1
MFEFFAKIGSAIVKAWKAADTLQKISYVFSAVTLAVGVKGFLQARQMLAKGQDIMANKTAAGGKIPVIYGTRRVGAQIVYLDTKANHSKDLYVVYALSVGEVEDILQYTIELDGNPLTDPKQFRNGGYVGTDKITSGNYSLNSANQSAGDRNHSGDNEGGFYPDPTKRYDYVLNLHHGGTSQAADPMLRASIPEQWSTNHKLNGIAYIAAFYRYDKHGMFRGVPQLTVQVKGKKVYDPRSDTTAWSSNAALCFLDYIQNDEYGKGLATADINMSTFETAADKCDALQNQPFYGSSYQNVTFSASANTRNLCIQLYDDAFQNKVDEVISVKDSLGTTIIAQENINAWKSDEFYDGTRDNCIIIDEDIDDDYDDEDGSIFTQVKRFHCNGYVDTNKNVMDNAKELLANMRGIFTYINGKYELQIEDTGSSTFSITDDHIIAESGVSVDYGNKDKKANKVIVEFFNANLKYELDTVTEFHDATPNYYSDDGEVLEIKAEFPYVTDPYIASNMAKAILGRSRNQTTVQFLGTPEMYKLNVGDIVDLTYAGLGFSSKLFRIEALELQSNGLVSVSMIEYLDVYTWEVPTQEPTTDPLNIPNANAVKAPSNVAFTDTNASSIGRPILSWDAPTDFPVKEFRVDVTDSSSNNVMSKIVDTNTADLSFIPKGTNYNYSITSINGLKVESDPTIGTFTIADDPVKTTEVDVDGENLSNLIGYGTVSGQTGNYFKITQDFDLLNRFDWQTNGTNYWQLGTGGDADVNISIKGSADKLILFRDQASDLGSVKLAYGGDPDGDYNEDFVSLVADWSNAVTEDDFNDCTYTINAKASDNNGSSYSGRDIAIFKQQVIDGYGTSSTILNSPLYVNNVNINNTGDSILVTVDSPSSSAAPVITLKRDSSSPADADYLGQLKFKGENDADQEVVYAKITAKIGDVTDGTEDGIIEFAVKKAGSNAIVARQTSSELKLINGTGLTVAGTTELGTTTIDGDATIYQALSVQGIINANTSSIRIKNQTPASASATGTTGTIVYDSNYIYVCVATNTWKRVAISTW